jgi:hypothetical protein
MAPCNLTIRLFKTRTASPTPHPTPPLYFVAESENLMANLLLWHHTYILKMDGSVSLKPSNLKYTLCPWSIHSAHEAHALHLNCTIWIWSINSAPKVHPLHHGKRCRHCASLSVPVTVVPNYGRRFSPILCLISLLGKHKFIRVQEWCT